jgi:hypothetical protein
LKLKPITRITLETKQFQNGERLFNVEHRPPERMKVWTLYKRSTGRIKAQVEYRILSDIERQVPIAIQRLKAS